MRHTDRDRQRETDNKQTDKQRDRQTDKDRQIKTDRPTNKQRDRQRDELQVLDKVQPKRVCNIMEKCHRLPLQAGASLVRSTTLSTLAHWANEIGKLWIPLRFAYEILAPNMSEQQVQGFLTCGHLNIDQDGGDKRLLRAGVAERRGRGMEEADPGLQFFQKVSWLTPAMRTAPIPVTGASEMR